MNAFDWFKMCESNLWAQKEPWGQMGSKGFVSSFEQFLVVLDHWPVFWYHHPDRHLDIEAEILVEIVVECWQPSK